MSAKGIHSITGYIADQTPSRRAIHHWIPFLNHDTPVFTGAEKISRKIHAAAYYIDMRRPERNKYIGRFIKLSSDVASESVNKVTETYFRMLEDSIKRQPPLWLWTHRRWKHRRPDSWIWSLETFFLQNPLNLKCFYYLCTAKETKRK